MVFSWISPGSQLLLSLSFATPSPCLLSSGFLHGPMWLLQLQPSQVLFQQEWWRGHAKTSQLLYKWTFCLSLTGWTLDVRRSFRRSWGTDFELGALHPKCNGALSLRKGETHHVCTPDFKNTCFLCITLIMWFDFYNIHLLLGIKDF